MPAPTWANQFETAVSTGASKTLSVTVLAGDVLLLDTRTYDSDGSSVIQTPSGGGYTWTPIEAIATSGWTQVATHYANITADATFDISQSVTDASQVWNMYAVAYRGSGGIGVTGKTSEPTGQTGEPSITLNGVSTDSHIYYGNSDWNELTGARTYITATAGAFTEKDFTTATGFVRYNGEYATAQTAGDKTVGQTAPTGQRHAAVAIEILAGGVAAPTVGAGADAAHTVDTAFARTASENANGATITARAWTIQSGPAGVGSTIGTAAALSWTPTVTGSYVLRYSATNSEGTGTDDVTVTVEPARVTGTVSYVGAGGWATGTTSLAPAYPSGLAEHDVCYMTIHSKPFGTAIPPPTDWTLVGEDDIGSGTAGIGTGPTRVTEFRRVVPSGGLSGTVTVSIPSGNVGHAQITAYRSSAWEPGTVPNWTEAFSAVDVASGTTGRSGSPAAGANGSVVAGDYAELMIGVTDDTSTITLGTPTLTGVTLGTWTATAAQANSSGGQDIGVRAWNAPVSAGSNTAATWTVPYSLSAAETSGVAMLRVHSAIVPVQPSTGPEPGRFLLAL